MKIPDDNKDETADLSAIYNEKVLASIYDVRRYIHT